MNSHSHLDLNTVRATIKTQKVLARVSLLDVERTNYQRPVDLTYRALLIFCDDLRCNVFIDEATGI